MNPMLASPYCLDLIRRSEGLRLNVYADPGRGLSTIGYGHLLTQGDLMTGRFTRGLTLETAEALLRQDVSVAERAVQSLVKVQLTQGQFDALVDFVFNLGAVDLRDSTLLKLLNAGHHDQVPAQLLRWNKSHDEHGNLVVLPGLDTRRHEEVKFWLK